MKTWIAFLRGIGGGIRPMPMAELKAVLEKQGLENVRTYIQTGNVVFQSRKGTAQSLTKEIAASVSRKFGFEAKLIVLSVEGLKRAADANPYPKAEAVPTSLHLFFLATAPKSPDFERMDELKAKSESYVLKDKVFYMYAPQGFGISKLAARAERLLGVDATARNWRTVTKMLELAAK
jgi:uncharacterized protein (DUF1697 family)